MRRRTLTFGKLPDRHFSAAPFLLILLILVTQVFFLNVCRNTMNRYASHCPYLT